MQDRTVDCSRPDAATAKHTETPQGGVNWSGCKVTLTRQDGATAHCGTSEIGFRQDGVLMWRYRADWSSK